MVVNHAVIISDTACMPDNGVVGVCIVIRYVVVCIYAEIVVGVVGSSGVCVVCHVATVIVVSTCFIVYVYDVVGSRI